MVLIATLETTPEHAQDSSEKVEVGKGVQGEAQAHSIATPEVTPGPDEARNRADDQRREAISTETTEHLGPKSPHHLKDQTSNPHRIVKRRGESALQKNLAKKKVISNVKRSAVARVPACEPTAYSDILGLKPDSSKEQVLKAYRNLAKVTNPKYNKNKGASDAHKCK